MKDMNFPTIDPKTPYMLSKEEENLLNTIEASFLHSEQLQRHVKFLFSHGAMYMRINGNLLYHGCIPMTDKGEFENCTINGATYKGRRLLDYIDQQVRNAYFNPSESDEIGRSGDIMWYLWLGNKSPLFGKNKMATFERLFIEDKSTHGERSDPYYLLINRREICEKILKEFNLEVTSSHILNGHVPVKIKDGESPIKGDGLLYIIDGGMSKAYQKTTGIAGYTFISSSSYMALTEHFPYLPVSENETQKFTSPKINIVEMFEKRIAVRDTDIGQTLQEDVEELKNLVKAYRKGTIKEIN
jgi:fructose-1,6-bisphosphatase-3